jgi:hypothetical protein
MTDVLRIRTVPLPFAFAGKAVVEACRVPKGLVGVARFGKCLAARLKERCLPGRGRSYATEVVTVDGQIMGTSYRITVNGLPKGTTAETLRHAVHAALDNVNKSMSAYRPDSELSRFKAHESLNPFAVSARTAEARPVSGKRMKA